MAAPPFPDPLELLRARLVKTVRATFNDASKGEAPVVISDEALFARDTPIRMVHADIVGMLVGGMASLLLQMLHPHALQGVLDFSDFRADMHGRLRATAKFIAVTTYGHRDEAEAAIAKVNAIHARVHGTLPDGTPYSALDPRTLAWVHVAEATMFLEAYLVHVRPDMPLAEQDEYFRQFAVIARKLGCDPVPESKAEAQAVFRELRADLRATPEAREVAALVVSGKVEGAMTGVQPFLADAAIALVPPFARTMLGLEAPGLRMVPSRVVTRAMGSTLRWAFRQNRNKENRSP
ncbi:oxygenase MpaB family protein [Aurantiacibacter luteus]|uniref:ER-bound oxygenase mpaB/mpaB'/Rubber oxygenase catalytic domain-containing protein n=1 Tax=Aurantiacibacter luteus TaxID=1581420 RepID=A0A0G9N0V1_9SPHN|nr:oxygenase MpaB family protein [Aurantiacibacter luteus]KLE35153.1 hypothetical protein AAW00_01330 [Aurantiacibacter luteus]